ncbi:hypothetical protein WJX75_003652 [Coccomyxa subellipsoidea]|uniref:C2H2-type domain-containing protein n=1 Tax=Coccomyxa subellipsoidea TaxID=248742 RepID=A0ABR2YYU1_9CHLO
MPPVPFRGPAKQCAQGQPKSLPKGALQSLCPKCGCPQEVDSEHRRTCKLSMHRRRRKALKNRQPRTQPQSTLCVYSCQACGYDMVLPVTSSRSMAAQVVGGLGPGSSQLEAHGQRCVARVIAFLLLRRDFLVGDAGVPDDLDSQQ